MSSLVHQHPPRPSLSGVISHSTSLTSLQHITGAAAAPGDHRCTCQPLLEHFQHGGQISLRIHCGSEQHTVTVSSQTTASDVCRALCGTDGEVCPRVYDKHWTLVHTNGQLERSIEDDESMLDLVRSWLTHSTAYPCPAAGTILNGDATSPTQRAHDPSPHDHPAAQSGCRLSMQRDYKKYYIFKDSVRLFEVAAEDDHPPRDTHGRVENYYASSGTKFTPTPSPTSPGEGNCDTANSSSPHDTLPQLHSSTSGNTNSEWGSGATDSILGKLEQFTSSNSSVRTVCGFLFKKDVLKKTWRKIYHVLEISSANLYASNKGTTTERRHLMHVAQISDYDTYTCSYSKHMAAAPTDHCFLLKHKTLPDSLKYLCAETEKERLMWTTAFRIAKYGSRLVDSYKSLDSVENTTRTICGTIKPRSTPRTSSNRVVMDFTGNTGRILEQVNQKSADHEKHADQRKDGDGSDYVNLNRPIAAANWNGAHHLQTGHLTPDNDGLAHVGHGENRGHTNRANSTTHSKLLASSTSRANGCSAAGAGSLWWYHAGVSGEAVVHLMVGCGLVDGVWLVRDSQSQPGQLVLTYCNNYRIKHHRIITQLHQGDASDSATPNCDSFERENGSDFLLGNGANGSCTKSDSHTESMKKCDSNCESNIKMDLESRSHSSRGQNESAVQTDSTAASEVLVQCGDFHEMSFEPRSADMSSSVPHHLQKTPLVTYSLSATEPKFANVCDLLAYYGRSSGILPCKLTMPIQHAP